MGMYMGFKETGLSKYILFACFVLCSIQNMVLFLFRIFNLAQPQHHHDHQKLSGSSPVSAMVTREFLVVRSFKDIDERKDLEESCAVCLNEFEGDDKIRCLINCTHTFHQNCLDRWMDHVQGTCPICRTPILPYACQDEYNKRLDVVNNLHMKSY
ncbi:brassinosteroid-responsive RING protein 1 [Lactuca sativa]|uniref:brassinosteroid-responsive RING protein 1 n=1 Tax=Lactuca sativa TaxID=4236 RepID=UPI000CB9607C|nr:brassinosteroid-responsive RING protein 1 [Lactuca sativa]